MQPSTGFIGSSLAAVRPMHLPTVLVPATLMEKRDNESERGGPRVLLALDSSAAWSRGTVRGFGRVADEQGWTVLYYRPGADLDRLAAELQPDAAVIGPTFSGPWPERL